MEQLRDRQEKRKTPGPCFRGFLRRVGIVCCWNFPDHPYFVTCPPLLSRAQRLSLVKTLEVEEAPSPNPSLSIPRDGAINHAANKNISQPVPSLSLSICGREANTKKKKSCLSHLASFSTKFPYSQKKVSDDDDRLVRETKIGGKFSRTAFTWCGDVFSERIRDRHGSFTGDLETHRGTNADVRGFILDAIFKAR